MMPWALIALAVALDLLANMALKRSAGFTRPAWGLLAIALILSAFALLGIVVQVLPIAVAYAAWGGLGILSTALLSPQLDGQKLSPLSWLGAGIVAVSVVLLSQH